MWKFTPGGERAYTLKCNFSPISVNFQRNDQFHFLYSLWIKLNLVTNNVSWFCHFISGHGRDLEQCMALCWCKSSTSRQECEDSKYITLISIWNANAHNPIYACTPNHSDECSPDPTSNLVDKHTCNHTSTGRPVFPYKCFQKVMTEMFKRKNN